MIPKEIIEILRPIIEIYNEPDFDTAKDYQFEWLIWFTYLPGLLWVFGYPLELFLGNFAFFYLQTVALYNLLQVIFFGKSLKYWFERPFRRLIIGWNLFAASLICTAIPFVNLMSQPILAWAAVQDYYDYRYTISPFFDTLFNLQGEAHPQLNTISTI